MALQNIQCETFFIPKGLDQFFNKCGAPELMARLILGKALMLSKKKGHCVMTDGFIQALLSCKCSRMQIHRALNLLKTNNLIAVKRASGEHFGQREIHPNFSLLNSLESMQCISSDTTDCINSDTSMYQIRDSDVTKNGDLCISNDTRLYQKSHSDVTDTIHKIKNNKEKIRKIRIYIEKFLLQFFGDNINELIKAKEFFNADLAQAKKKIPFNGGEYENLSEWIYSNLKEWASELLSFKYTSYDNAGRSSFNLEPVLDFALQKFDESKGVHFLDFFQSVLLSNCKLILRKNKDGEDGYINTFGRLFERLMLQKWLYQLDTVSELTLIWAESYYFAFSQNGIKQIRPFLRVNDRFHGRDLIASTYVGTKRLVMVMFAWFLQFSMYRFKNHSLLCERWHDIFKHVKTEEEFIECTEEGFLQYFSALWPQFKKANASIGLPVFEFNELIDEIMKEHK